MHRRHDTSLLKKSLWVLYLAVSLVFVQAAGVHVHVYSHDAGSVDHGHHEQAHFAYGDAVPGHVDEVAEVDVSPQGLLKNVSFGTLVMALVMTVMILLLPRLLTRLFGWHHRGVPHSVWPFSLRPPLRAPPL